jgi:secreted PhoX family phosphatase
MARVKIGAISENSDYTGFIAFAKKDCTLDFLRKLNEGVVRVDLVDQSSSYQIESHFLGQEQSHTNVVVQFRHTACVPTEEGKKAKCLGNTKMDQAELIVMGINEVNFGTKKSIEMCLTNARLGYLGTSKNDISDISDTDFSPCVSWTNKYWP